MWPPLARRALLAAAAGALLVGLVTACGGGGAHLLAPRLPEAELRLPPDEQPVPLHGAAPPRLIQSAALIHAGSARTTYSVDGTGYAVAVLDTGCYTSHSDFPGGKIVYQHNYSTENAADGNDVTDNNGHGTHVASTIAGNGTHTGIAPGADLVILKVLPGTTTAEANALDWLIANHDTYNITAVNMSLGVNVNWTSVVTNYSGIQGKVETLRAAGVAVAIAAGNGFYTASSAQGMDFPAIIPDSTSVGAVYDADTGGWSYGSGAVANSSAADRICPFSQRLSDSTGGAYRTDVFAPGAVVTAAGTSSTTASADLHGTSMATPVAAGSIVLLQQYYANLWGVLPTVDQVEGWLRDNATTANDGDDEDDNVTHTGADFKRLDVLAAMDAMPRPPDLEITAVTPSTTTPMAGATFSVDVTVHNRGSGNAGAFVVGLYQDLAAAPTTASTADATLPIASLNAGASTTVTFSSRSYPSEGTYTLWALADSAAAVNESDETNNYGPASGRTMTVVSAVAAPTNLGLSPGSVASRAGELQALVAGYRDANGAGTIAYAALAVDGSALRARWVRATNRLYLQGDDGSSWLGGFAPGSYHTVRNREGWLDCRHTTIGESGNDLTISWSLLPNGEWTGSTRGVSTMVQDQAALGSGWSSAGQWTVQPAAFSFAIAGSAGFSGQAHDTAVSSLTAAPATWSAGGTGTLTVRLANPGRSDERSQVLTVYDGLHPLARLVVDFLGKGAWRQGSLSCPAPYDAGGALTLSAALSPARLETATGNNSGQLLVPVR
ncbi:MAG: S8 family serine peptidase [Armatimonadetes bacterium]|nr:S8 family serine peptidase [Armatimonadota bacterium]